MLSISPVLMSVIFSSPAVIAAADKYVAATILSGMTAYSQPLKYGTPVMLMVPLPAPTILAPQQLR